MKLCVECGHLTRNPNRVCDDCAHDQLDKRFRIKAREIRHDLRKGKNDKPRDGEEIRS